MQATRRLSTAMAIALFGAGTLALSGTAQARGTSATTPGGQSGSSQQGQMGHTGGSMGGGSSAMGHGKTRSHHVRKAHISNAKVKHIQRALRQAGYQIKVDGMLGPHTEHALRQYQRKNHLRPTGTPDSKTLRKLGVTTSAGSSMNGRTKHKTQMGSGSGGGNSLSSRSGMGSHSGSGNGMSSSGSKGMSSSSGSKSMGGNSGNSKY